MPPDPEEIQPGDRGTNWFAIEITAEHVIAAGERGTNWFAIDVVSEHVPVDVEEPPIETPHVGSGTEGGFFGPIVPEPVRFRFRGRAQGPRVEPVVASFTASSTAVKRISTRIEGASSAVREVRFVTSGHRDPAHRWSMAIQDDEDILLSLF